MRRDKDGLWASLPLLRASHSIGPNRRKMKCSKVAGRGGRAAACPLPIISEDRPAGRSGQLHFGLPDRRRPHVSFGGLSRGAKLLDHLVRAREHGRRHLNAERVGSLEVDDEFVFHRRLHRQVRRLLAFQDAVDIAGGPPELVDEIGAEEINPPLAT